MTSPGILDGGVTAWLASRPGGPWAGGPSMLRKVVNHGHRPHTQGHDHPHAGWCGACMDMLLTGPMLHIRVEDLQDHAWNVTPQHGSPGADPIRYGPSAGPMLHINVDGPLDPARHVT